MLTESTVLLVWTSQFPELLVEQLELQDVFVESIPLDDVERALTVVGPDLLVHMGREGVERVVALLEEQAGTRRVRLALVVPRASLDELRKLGRSVVLSVLPEDLPQQMLVERIVQLARRSAGTALATASPRPAIPRPAVVPRPAPAPAAVPQGTSGTALDGAVRRIALVDDDVTRADAVGAALREWGFAVQLLPVDADRVRWPLLRNLAPQVVVTDGADRPPHQWLELLRTDAELQAARLVTVPYAQVFDETTGAVTLAALLDRLAHVRLPVGGSADSDDDDEGDRPTLIADDDRPTLVASDAQQAAIEASAAQATEQAPAQAEAGASGERESSEGLESIEEIESLAPEAMVSDVPPEDPELPTVPLGLPIQELLAAASVQRSSQSFRVEPSFAAEPWLDAETPSVEVPTMEPVPGAESLSAEASASEPEQAAEPSAAPESVAEPSQVAERPSVAVDLLLESLERASSEVVDSGASLVAVPAEAVPIDAGAAAAIPAQAPSGAAESDAALSITAAKKDVPLGGPTADAHSLAGPPLRAKSGSAGRWLGLGAAACLLAGGGFWALRLRAGGVANSNDASPKAVATQASLPEAAANAAPSLPPSAAAAKALEAASEPGTEPAPWRVADNPQLTRCDRQVSDYAALPQVDAPQASRSWEKARSALLLGNLEKARDLMCRAVLMHAESIALEGLAEIYLTLGSPEQAKLWVDVATRVRPDRQKTRELLGDIENQRGRLAASRELWLRGLAIAPDDQKTLDWLAKKQVVEAQDALRSGSAHRAEVLYRRAATLSASNADAPAGLARLALKAGNQEQASRWVTVALERAAGHSDAQVVQGDLALARGDSESARQSYQRALEKNPFNRGALEQLARLAK